MAEQEGTGKHPHKSSEEPWPHTKGSSEGEREGERKEARGDERGGERRESRSEEQDLKKREYRDEQGEIHHHTRTYEEQHEGEDRSEHRKAS